MDLYIYNEAIELIGVTDCYASLIWIRRYSSAGSFELYVPLTSEAAVLLMPRRYIYRSDTREAMYISGVTDTSGADGRHIRVTGYSLDKLLSKRCILSDSKDNFSILAGVKAILDAEPLGADIEYIGAEYDTVAREMPRAEMLSDWVRSGCRLADLSYKISLVPQSHKLRLELFKGRDLSDEVVFGDSWGNLNNMEYAYSEEGCSNVIICACNEPTGGVEYYSLPTYTLGDAQGLSRSEELVFVDPIVKTGYKYFDENGDPLDPPEKYQYVDNAATLTKMQEAAAAVRSEYTESYSADALGVGYRKGWDIGDIVTVRNEMRGTAYVKRIEEVREVFDTAGTSVIPTFGDTLKTIVDLIQKKRR